MPPHTQRLILPAYFCNDIDIEIHTLQQAQFKDVTQMQRNTGPYIIILDEGKVRLFAILKKEITTISDSTSFSMLPPHSTISSIATFARSSSELGVVLYYDKTTQSLVAADLDQEYDSLVRAPPLKGPQEQLKRVTMAPIITTASTSAQTYFLTMDVNGNVRILLVDLCIHGRVWPSADTTQCVLLPCVRDSSCGENETPVPGTGVCECGKVP